MVRSIEIVTCFKMPRANQVVPAERESGIYTIDMSSTSTLDVAEREVQTQPSAIADKMQARRHNLLWHLLIDLPIFVLVAGAIILFELGVFPSHKAGFWCRDPALSFTHIGDTFTITVVGAITIFLPLIVIWTVEALSHRQDEYTLKQSRLYASGKPTLIIYKDYIYGAVVNLTILEALKCLVGSPRPSFFDLCEPDKAATCNESEYVTNYVCTSARYSTYLQIDSSRSFPSAHSSLATYCGLFVVWYLQRRAFSWHSRSVLLVPLIQGLCVLYAAATSLTRLSDNRHHWWDVLAGVVIGSIITIYTVQVLCKNFSQPAVPSTSDISSSDGNNHQSVRRLLSREPHVVIP